ncbi:hypothetical protein [Candidatus Binatus sp.]|uniref:hypothetical protein n=1 Tax=Candidatus Binatus sp. TaxID=2811406 RepID=UPI003C78C059
MSDTCFHERINETIEAVSLLVILVRVHPGVRSGANLCKRCADELAAVELAPRDLAAEQGDCAIVRSHRDTRIALIGECLQELPAVGLEPIGCDLSCYGLLG